MVKYKNYIIALRELSAAATYHNTSLIFQLRRFRYLHNKLMFSLNDTLFWGLTNPEISKESLGDYMSFETVVRIRDRFNPRSATPDVEDKSRFYCICTEHGIPIPENFGILPVENDVIGSLAPLTKVSPPVTTDLTAVPNGSLVAKPTYGANGKNIFFINKVDDQFYTGGQSLSAESLRHRLADIEPDGRYILQRRLWPHESLRALSGSSAVQSVRVVTFLDRKDQPHVLFARIKIVRGDSEVDNFSHGDYGNLLGEVDVDNGRILKVVTKDVSKIGLQRIRYHPDTGKDMSITLPDWQRVVQLAQEGAKVFNGTRSLGWDIALTPDGPVVLEANYSWAIFPIGPNKRPTQFGGWNSFFQ